MPLIDIQCEKCGHEQKDLIIDQGDKIIGVCPKCQGLMKMKFPTGIASILKGPGFHKNDYPGKGKKILTNDSVKKLDKEQKLALAVQSVEQQTGRDFKEIVDSCKDNKTTAKIEGSKISTNG
jgi:predicted nucleic acid-binding Zn ribbon protein